MAQRTSVLLKRINENKTLSEHSHNVSSFHTLKHAGEKTLDEHAVQCPTHKNLPCSDTAAFLSGRSSLALDWCSCECIIARSLLWVAGCDAIPQEITKQSAAAGWGSLGEMGVEGFMRGYIWSQFFCSLSGTSWKVNFYAATHVCPAKVARSRNEIFAWVPYFCCGHLIRKPS